MWTLAATPIASARAMATDHGQSVAGSHVRMTTGANTAPTKIDTHCNCTITRAASAQAPWPRANRDKWVHADPINKAMPGRQGTK
jgi:hypothetical protein